MKIGVSYSVFDGIELLENSIKQIRNHVHHIDVQYQEISWFGKRAKIEDLEILKRLKEKKLIDSLSLFNSFYTIQPIKLYIMQSKVFETTKRNIGLDICRKNGCTHFMNIDVDEFYDTSQFKSAIDIIKENELEATALHYINYVTPTLHRGYAPHLVPFIYKITESSIHSKYQPFFQGVDPTRGIQDDSYTRWRLFDKDVITMHHMEMVRKDLKTKYDSTSRFYLERDKINDLVQLVEESKEKNSIEFKGIIYPGMKGKIDLIQVENKFKIDIWSK